MSIFRSYFSRNNTIISNSYTNTGRNPVTELFYGGVQDLTSPIGFSRFIFDIDLSQLRQLYYNGTISTGCSRTASHTLKMTNTSAFDTELLNSTTSEGRRRATSFNLILFRIPVSGCTGSGQTWDEGVGYDYYNSATNLNSSNGSTISLSLETDKSFSTRPSNWYQSETISNWGLPGIYDNTNSISGNTCFNYSGLTIVATQHFEFGNENIEFDMTNEINQVITGNTSGFTGWGIAYVPEIENISGLTENYSVGFFTRHTQTFYEPFLETNYDDLILDDRNSFYQNKVNHLYLYSYINGQPTNFDNLPIVNILNSNDEYLGSTYTGLSTCLITEGVYEVTVPIITGQTTPCMFYDQWSGITINGVEVGLVTNEFVIQQSSGYYQIGSSTKDPSIYGFDFSGVKQNEKILNTDVRKVNVTIKKAYTPNEVLNDVQAYYRVYVREGANTEVQVQDWTRINKTPDAYYFIFDTRDKVPNQYYVDIKVLSDYETNTYKRELTFQIVNKI